MTLQRAFALVFAAACAALLASAPARAAGEAKYVLFFLGDGMGPATTTAARIWKYGEAGRTTLDALPYAARVKTHSLDAQTTDGAAAMSAYMTGLKTRNGVVSMDAATHALPYRPAADAATRVADAVDRCPSGGNGAPAATLLELAIARGKAVGVVTTARLTHATPAAAYAHVCHRDAEYDIARQAVPGGAGYNRALGAGVDVLLGGVSRYWRPYHATSNPRGRPDGRDLVAELRARGYAHSSDLASLDAAPTAAGSRLIGLYDFASAQGHMSFDADRDPAREPSLAQMTAKAIDILSKDADGFFLLVEGGRIDHAMHATNAARALADTIAFDDAVRAALDRMRALDPTLAATLLVVTADHDHAMAFNGYARRGGDVLGVNVSYGSGLPGVDAAGNSYATLVFGNGPNRPDVRAPLDAATVNQGNKEALQEAAIRRDGAGSASHGGGDVALYAAGAAARGFKGTLDNTRVFGLVRAAAGY